ncbi:hypothetical protein Lalb_Chr16g0376781 [Lupinus albus]|uniref:Uncharacterized protein n=1 Tax=Lupinus albus TaxID=3870 RepID=A0A6A4NS22_LUPAL|nr:hypothetical protein Lalb_Chr16g0376781 [Lupinus albus]
MLKQKREKTGFDQFHILGESGLFLNPLADCFPYFEEKTVTHMLLKLEHTKRRYTENTPKKALKKEGKKVHKNSLFLSVFQHSIHQEAKH